MKKIALILAVLMILAAGCSSDPAGGGAGTDADTAAGTPDTDAAENKTQDVSALNAQMPDDFSFSLTWNCYGVSSYDSASGKLVKTTDSTHPDDYVTEYKMSREELEEIYSLLTEMDPFSYPDEYNPIKSMSTPSRTVILSVSANGRSKTISCKNISLGDDADGDAGEKFMKVHDRIVGILTASDAWSALPEYEVLYE